MIPRTPSPTLFPYTTLFRSFTAACIVAGALIGWAVGRVGIGIALGAVVGIPVGVATTIVKYRNVRSEEHTSELQSQSNVVCRLLLEKKNTDTSDCPRIGDTA